MAITPEKLVYTWHGCGIGADHPDVVLIDQHGEHHVFHVDDVAGNPALMDSLSPRANFCIGVLWEEVRAARDFELVAKVETATPAMPSTSTLQ